MMIWFGAGVLAVALLYGGLSVFLPEQLRRQKIGRREALSFDVIFHQYFSHLPYSQQVLHKLWEEAAEQLNLDQEKLRPTDRFGKELAVAWFPLVDLNEELLVTLHERLRLRGEPTRQVRLSNLADYIAMLASIEPSEPRAEQRKPV